MNKTFIIGKKATRKNKEPQLTITKKAIAPAIVVKCLSFKSLYSLNIRLTLSPFILWILFLIIKQKNPNFTKKYRYN